VPPKANGGSMTELAACACYGGGRKAQSAMPATLYARVWRAFLL